MNVILLSAFALGGAYALFKTKKRKRVTPSPPNGSSQEPDHGSSHYPDPGKVYRLTVGGAKDPLGVFIPVFKKNNTDSKWASVFVNKLPMRLLVSFNSDVVFSDFVNVEGSFLLDGRPGSRDILVQVDSYSKEEGNFLLVVGDGKGTVGPVHVEVLPA